MFQYWGFRGGRETATTVVQAAFEQWDDRIGFVFGDDGDPTHTDYGTHGFFSADYTDTWLNDVADRIGRKQRVPIVTEHMHFSFGKSPLDLTYAESRVRLWADDNQGIPAHDGSMLAAPHRCSESVAPTVLLQDIVP